LLVITANFVWPITAHATHPARWIWRADGDPAPRNTFTYFRKQVYLKQIPADATLHFAADSNAHLWVNGHVLQRKMTRYFEENIRTEALDARPYLHTGWNSVVVLHHNWGSIITFQRSGNVHAGMYLRSAWINSDDSWRVLPAPEFEASTDQITGITGDQRIRFPQVIDGEHMPDPRMWRKLFNDSTWQHAVVVKNGPWPEDPQDVETLPQQEKSVQPESILAAGVLNLNGPLAERPIDIAQGISHASYHRLPAVTDAAKHLLAGGAFTLQGKAGTSKYIVVDFGRPIHGFPELSLTSTAAGQVIDFGYGELSLSQYSGKSFVRPDGWIDPERVVGHGYADRYRTRAGAQHVEMPDERTARWFSVLVHFQHDGEVRFSRIGFVQSMYPVAHIGSFHTGDLEIDRIMQLAMRHARVTMSDVYVDTPGREDGMWIEDARPRAELSARWFGDTALRQLFLRIVAESQRSNGNLHPFPPASYPIGPVGFYDWTIEWAGALYDQYEWSGNKEDVNRYWPQLTKLWGLELAQLDSDGIWRSNKVLADIRVGEHPKNGDESSGIATAQLVVRLRESITLAHETGHSEQEEQWTTALKRMEEAFRTHLIVPADGSVPAHVPDVISSAATSSRPRGYSQAAQAMAALADLIPPDQLSADIAYAFPQPDGSPSDGVTRWNNPTYAYRVLRMLSDNKHADLAVRHLRERYEPYLAGDKRNHVAPQLQGKLGGPLPEYFVSRDDLKLSSEEKDTAQPVDETGSHGWGAVPLLWAHDTLLGVRITQAGGAQLSIAPQDGGLPYVQGTTYTPHGVVSVDWRPELQQLKIRVPVGVTYRLTLPGRLQTETLKSIPSGCTKVDNRRLDCSGAPQSLRFVARQEIP
jgi:hypothetical protein